MGNLLLAYSRAFKSLIRPDIFWHLLWPTLLAMAFWIGIGVLFWSQAADGLVQFVQSWPVVGAWFSGVDNAQAALAVAANIFILVVFIPLVFVTSAILLSMFALPLMLDRVTATDYRDIEQRRGGSFAGSIVNASWSLLLFIAIVIVTLPLWLIPGVGFVLSVLFAAWLNQRCYRYDALMNHADKAEMKRVPASRRGGMYALGISAGVLAFIPFINLLVPALTGLAFIHYLLNALRVERAAAVSADGQRH